MFSVVASVGIRKQLIATDNDSVLVYTECENDNSTWPGRHHDIARSHTAYGNHAATCLHKLNLACRTLALVWQFLNRIISTSMYIDGVPSDGTPISILVTYYKALYIAYNIAVVLGLVFAVFCLLFNFIFRKRKLVQRKDALNNNTELSFGNLTSQIVVVDHCNVITNQ